jgi:predicted 3-demethylubiquinone-9 3-methyltransferase (glyoxalase superfamily)
MQKTVTFLMFVGEQCGKAEEAINFYISLFKDSGIQHIEYFEANDTRGKEGSVKLSTFTLAGQAYMAIDSSAEHKFTFNPAVSIFVNCDSEGEIDTLYKSLSEGGGALMPLGDYGFSKKFGWVADKYGVSWQLNLKQF